MRTNLYIETSVWGFYYDEAPHNQRRRDAVRLLFEQIRAGIFEAWVSPVVIGEIEASEEPYRSRDLALIEEVGATLFVLPKPQLAELLALYRAAGVLPEECATDLLHCCYVTLDCRDHALVSYNCRHLANYSVARRIRAVNLVNGYRTDFEILTPEEIVQYGTAGR